MDVDFYYFFLVISRQTRVLIKTRLLKSYFAHCKRFVQSVVDFYCYEWKTCGYSPEMSLRREKKRKKEDIISTFGSVVCQTRAWVINRHRVVSHYSGDKCEPQTLAVVCKYLLAFCRGEARMKKEKETFTSSDDTDFKLYLYSTLREEESKLKP